MLGVVAALKASTTGWEAAGGECVTVLTGNAKSELYAHISIRRPYLSIG